MVRHGGSSAGSYLADPTSPIPSHCASIVATSTLRVNISVYTIFPEINALEISNHVRSMDPRIKQNRELFK